MKRILCTTDFSENAEKALKYAYGLSMLFNCELVIAHIHDIPTILSGPSDAATSDDLSKGVNEMNLEKLCSICEDQLGFNRDNIRFEERENKSSIDGIIAMIDETQADLVVMGRKGKSNLKEILMGRTSVGVIRNASCPVITIPENANPEPIIKKIAYATDLDKNNFDCINGLTELATRFDAEISIVHVVLDSDEFEDNKLKSFEKSLTQKVNYKKLGFNTLRSNNKSESLSNYLSEENISVLAMFEHENKSFFDSWFKKDLVKELELKIDIPLISFNQNYLKALNTTKKS